MVPASFQKIFAVFRDVITVHVRCYFCSLFVYFTLHSAFPDLRKPTRSRSNIDCFIFVCANSVGILEEPELVRLSGLRLAFSFSRFGLAPTKMPQLLWDQSVVIFAVDSLPF